MDFVADFIFSNYMTDVDVTAGRLYRSPPTDVYLGTLVSSLSSTWAAMAKHNLYFPQIPLITLSTYRQSNSTFLSHSMLAPLVGRDNLKVPMY